MARLLRVAPPNIPIHIVQRGNNRQVCFVTEEDYGIYIGCLKEYSKKYSVEVHAWVLMTNHVHLLCTPLVEGAVSRMMQALGRRYVRYFNYEYKRSGTLWEGRYKSSLIQESDYLLEVYRYIELNPVRANMVDDPSDYYWSSYQMNGLGRISELCTPHLEYLGLGDTGLDCQKRYRSLFAGQLDKELLTEIRESTNRCMAVGNDIFKAEIELLTGRRLSPKKRGRPVGWRKNQHKTV